MIIYLDSDFRCYTDYADGRQTVETDFFDGKSREYIEGYRYVPDGQTWTRSDGVQFQGIMIAPAMDYNKIMTNVAISYLDDDQAESVSVLFPEWAVGVQYRAEDKEKGISADRVQYDGLLYRCIQSHVSQSDWTPDITPALWVRTSTEEWQLWKQPQGAHDAYRIGDKCSYPTKDRHWICTADYNIYPPDVSGWEEVL